MRSDEGQFWDERFRREGAIWGEGPSPTVKALLRYLPAKARVLEVGFGYGRDLAFLLGHGHRAWGVDLSAEGRRLAEERLGRAGLAAERLLTGAFEASDVPDGQFDAVFSHRVAHLLVTDEAVATFTERVRRALRPGGVLCVGARNEDDLNPAEMRCVGGSVYEYAQRPGHRIRYWDDAVFRDAFENDFLFLTLDRVYEAESRSHPVPCHLTVMVGSKKVGARDGDGPARACPDEAGAAGPRPEVCGAQP